MPRGPRLDSPGTLHHVIIRGIEKREIVADDKDRGIFVSRMGSVALKTGTNIYAWALMTNHAHILLKAVNQYSLHSCGCFLPVSCSETSPLFGVSASAVCQIIKTSAVAGCI